ncbi:MAG: sigma-54-dependent Fis family transcriptional regulator, partial [Fibrobacteres bacterium]|nr:sigma-54-dependent Fis family transcriptional regulator [Fibrobacterota bacterium]
FDRFFEFHSSVPLSKLLITKKDTDEFESHIVFSELTKAVEPFRSNPLCICNNDGRIIAFNTKFLSELPNTKNILGQELKYIFRPSPFLSITTLLTADNIISIFNEETAPIPLHSKRISNLTRLGDYCDIKNNDFSLTVSFTVSEGSLPSIIANGLDITENILPDIMGYLIGPDAYGKGWQIKKEGNPIHTVPAILPDLHSSVTYKLFKRGYELLLTVNNKPVIRYCDHSFTASDKSFFYLYQRKTGNILIHSCELSLLPADIDTQSSFRETIFVSSGKTALFHPVHNNVFYKPDSQLYCFLFYDITSLKNVIAGLEKSVQIVARERDNFRKLATLDHAQELQFIGNCDVISRIRNDIKKAAPTSLSILIEGETGTGKEVLADYIHRKSDRHNGPFIKVDCSAIPESLLESELFGVEKGAFTGAYDSRPGKFEIANGGTLFLDELSGINLNVQAKLLGVLQDFTFTPLGGKKVKKVNCRLICASNRSLKDMVNNGLFRSDLYFRLNSIGFKLPPLRERIEDLQLLCNHFLSLANSKLGRTVKGFNPDALKKITTYSWPGNIRELQHTIEKAVLFAEDDLIYAKDIILNDLHSNVVIRDTRMLTKEKITALLERNNYIIARAIKDSGIPRATFFRKMKLFGIKRL